MIGRIVFIACIGFLAGVCAYATAAVSAVCAATVPAISVARKYVIDPLIRFLDFDASPVGLQYAALRHAAIEATSPTMTRERVRSFASHRESRIVPGGPALAFSNSIPRQGSLIAA